MTLKWIGVSHEPEKAITNSSIKEAENGGKKERKKMCQQSQNHFT